MSKMAPNLIFQKKNMAIKGWPVSVMYLPHVSNNVIMVTKGWPVSVMYLPHVSNNGHQGMASFCYVPISCE